MANKVDVTYDAKRKGVVVFIPYEGKPEGFAKSASGNSYMIGKTDKGFLSVPESPDPQLQVQVNLISVIPKDQRAKG